MMCFSASILLPLQVLDRGEKIELLVDKTENLRSQVCLGCFISVVMYSKTLTYWNDLLITNAFALSYIRICLVCRNQS